ncbi:MAG: hypothetical protein AAFP82_04635, partial [Bacteroidota bacterium]
MKTIKPSLIVFFILLSVCFTNAQSIVWQLHHGQGEGIFIPGPNDPSVEEILSVLTGNRQPVHGDLLVGFLHRQN